MNKILALTMLLFIGGCASTTVPVVVDRQTAIPEAARMVTYPFKWKIMNQADLEQAVTELRKQNNSDYSIFVLTPEGYRALSLNMIEMERYIKEQKAIIVFLKKELQGRKSKESK